MTNVHIDDSYKAVEGGGGSEEGGAGVSVATAITYYNTIKPRATSSSNSGSDIVKVRHEVRVKDRGNHARHTHALYTHTHTPHSVYFI